MQATSVVLQSAADGDPVAFNDAVAAVCQVHGVSSSTAHQTFHVGDDDVESLRNTAVIRYVRCLYATQLVVARLAAQGTIVPLDKPGSTHAEVRVPFESGGGMMTTSGQLSIAASAVVVPNRFMLTPGLQVTADVPLLASEKWSEGIGPLLTGRLPRLLDEALDAYRRGRYLSAATLIGSVAEGGWTRAGEMLRGRATKLDDALDEDRIAEVQKRLIELFRANKIRSADDLSSFATHVRTVRNYGIHPNAADNDAAEQALTEVGCFSLMQRTHSHLISLLSAVNSLSPVVD